MLYLLTTYLAILCCYILSQIKHIPTRKVFSTVTGISLGFYVYGQIYGWTIANILTNYLLMLLLPRNFAAGAMLLFSFSTLMVATYLHCHH